MISLYDTATLANTTPFVDTFGSDVIYGNILLYNDSTRSGSSAGRRIIKLAPDEVIPERRTLTNQLTGEIFLLSDPEYDAYRGKLIRAKYPAVRAKAATKFTVNELLTSAVGQELHVDINYLKRTVYTDRSEIDPGVYVYFSNYYSVAYGEVITVGSSYYKTRSVSRIDELGFHVVEAIQVTTPLQVVSVSAKLGYDEVMDIDSYTEYSDVTVFLEPAVLDFVNTNRSSEKIEDGDKLISVSKTDVASLTTGSLIGGYSVVSVSDKSDHWACHCRL